ncbi:MAG: HNH endonuclease [Desulfobacterales bacterium]|nr:HNH endonuclease [Desulfobacterales bacterium]
MARRHREKKVQHLCLACVDGQEYIDGRVEEANKQTEETKERLRNYWIRDWPERQLREFEFVDYLARLMKRNDRFRDVGAEVILDRDKRFRADIVVEELVDNRWEKIVVECKVQSNYTAQRSEDVLAQLRSYGAFLPGIRLVFAFPGNLTQATKAVFEDSGIEVWDLKYLADQFQTEVLDVEHPILQSMLLAAQPKAEKSREEDLIEQLQSCAPGRDSWLVYQQLIGSILETLLCPPLSTPISELSDAPRVNRRDFILPNYAENGFWAFLRDRYLADYVVVDAKNHAEEIKKEDALQIANYLKEHGVGLFGVIVCRKGADAGCIHTLREKWVIDQKLIIVLTDSDVEQMLLARQYGAHPESIIKQKIEDFRLSL